MSKEIMWRTKMGNTANIHNEVSDFLRGLPELRKVEDDRIREMAQNIASIVIPEQKGTPTLR